MIVTAAAPSARDASFSLEELGSEELREDQVRMSYRRGGGLPYRRSHSTDAAGTSPAGSYTPPRGRRGRGCVQPQLPGADDPGRAPRCPFGNMSVPFSVAGWALRGDRVPPMLEP